MGYQPKIELKLREFEAKVDFWHLMAVLILCTFVSLFVFIPSLLLEDPYAPIWFATTTFLSLPFMIWAHPKTHDIAIWWVMRPENKRLAEQNAKVLRNRIIRESEEFIAECRGKNEIQS